MIFLQFIKFCIVFYHPSMLQNLHECSGEKLKDLNGEDAPDWLMEHHGFPVITKSEEGNDIVCQQVRCEPPQRKGV